MDSRCDGVFLISGVYMILKCLLLLMAIYTMYLAIKSFKIYINNNS